MRLHLFAATAALTLMAGPALALDNAALDRAAALFDDYAPAEPDIALDELLGASDFEAAPDPSLIEELAPDVVLRAQADNAGSTDDFGDDFGGENTEAGSAVSEEQSTADSAPSDIAAAAPAAEKPAVVSVEPVVPDGWVSHERFGLGLALPPELVVQKEADDEVAFADTDMSTPKGCAVMVGLDRPSDPTEDLPPSAAVERLADRDLGFGTEFAGIRVKISQGGVEVIGAFVWSKEVFVEKDSLNIAASCANEPKDRADVLIEGVLGSLHLVAAPVLPVPESEKPRLGGLITGTPPEGWSDYRSNDSEWIIIAPAMQAGASFRLGGEALSALKDLAPERRSRQFAEDPAVTIEHVTMMGTEGWMFSGRIAPDDPEHGIYNGGMEGPNTYFFADRCMPDGDALVVSISAQQAWIDNGNSFDALLDSVAVHWPEGEAVCSDDVAGAMAAATQTSVPTAASASKGSELDAEPVEEAPEDVSTDAPSPVAGAEAEWRTYVDPQFGTSISYPADIFVVTTDAPDGQGVLIATADASAELKIGGMQVDEGVVIDDLMREMLAQPDFDTLTGMNRIDGNSFRLDGLDKGQRVTEIVALSTGSVLSLFTARYPEHYTDLVERIAGTFRVVEPQPAQPAQTGSPAVEPAVELAFWEAIKDSTDPADFQAYLDQFPNGVFSGLASIRINRYAGSGQAGLAAPVPVTPSTGVAPTSGPSGTFDSTGFGTIRFATGVDGAIVADYTSGQGRIDGRLQGTSLVGRWVQSTSSKRCADGSYWGKLQLEFAADFASFTGTWSYCDDNPGNPNTKGTRTGEGMPDLSLPASAATLTPPSPAGVDYAGPHDWQTYFNDRYGTVIDYPVDLFAALPPPANNDGRRFETADGQAGFYVFAQYNALGQSLQELFEQDQSLNADENITYKVVEAGMMGAGWFVVSGFRGADIFYRKTLLGSDGLLQVFEIRYRSDLKDALDAIVTRMAISFGGMPQSSGGGGAGSGPNGTYSTNWSGGGATSIAIATDPDGSVWGDYDDGAGANISHLVGQMQGTTFIGRWTEPSSAQRCSDGTNWGEIEFNFTPDFNSFEGLWNYCEASPARKVTGTRTGDASNVSTPATVPSDQVLSPSTPAPSLGPFTTPARGTQERQEIMDAARSPVANDIGQSVIFVVDILRSDGHWAYLQATPVQPSGKPLDWMTTRYAADWKADVMSDTIMVLLSKDGGVWHTVDHIVGPTDVYWYGWIDQYQLPEALFRE